MAKPRLPWSQPLASCSILICMLQIMSWITKAEQSSVDLASCEELQCAHSNVCHTTFHNNTQSGHSRCLCQGPWAGLRCQAQIRVGVATLSTESVTLRLEAHGPPDWNARLELKELFIHELGVTFWNLNKSEDCNVLLISKPKDFYIRVEGLERDQNFLVCVGNGPSDSCSLLSESNSTLLAEEPNCVKLRTRYKEDVSLDVGLIIVPIAAFIFLIVVILLIYFKRNSLVVHFFLHFCCCRAWYCCRKRCIRRKIQQMRKQQQQQRDSSGNLLHHDVPLDDTMTFDLSVASTSLSSSALGNRSSIKSDSCRSARSVDSDNTIPPAYQDESCMSNPPPDTNAFTQPSLSNESFPFSKYRLSDPNFPIFNPDHQNWDNFCRQESPWCASDIHSDFEDRDLYRRTHFYQDDNFPENLSTSGVPTQLSWTAREPTNSALLGTFPLKARTLPNEMRTLPHFHHPKRSSTIIGIRRKASDAFFRPIDPTTVNDADSLSLQYNTLGSNHNPPNYVNLPPFTAISYRHSGDQLGLSATLPRAFAKKRSAEASPHENSTKVPEIYGPYVNLTQDANRFDCLTLPPRVSDVPQTSLPSNEAEDSNSTASKEEHAPRKRVKTLIGHFERSLPFLKPSTSSRPSSVHWEDEIRDLTSPLAVERAKLKKKRPRPWSLPVGLEIRSVASSGSQRRGKKPVFEGHPSLHILPPFTTDEEEEDEEEKEKDHTKMDVYGSFDVNGAAEKVTVSTPCLKKIKESGDFISSFEDDARNLVTPFICKDSENEEEDDDDNDEDNNEVKDMTIR